MSTNSRIEFDHAEFATLLSFLEKFGHYIGLEDTSYETIQSFLNGSRDNVEEFVKLHVKLLKGVGNTSHANAANWEKHLAKYCEDFPHGDDETIRTGGYHSLTPAAKLRILNNLLDEQFEYNSRFNEKVNEPSNLNCLRQEPLGKDKFGRLYWYFLDNELGLRVYREWRDVINEEYNWELVCQDEDELQGIIESLEKEEPPKETFKGMRWKQQKQTELKLLGVKECTVDVERLDEELVEKLETGPMKFEEIEPYLRQPKCKGNSSEAENLEDSKQTEVSSKESPEIVETVSKPSEKSESDIKGNPDDDKMHEASESKSVTEKSVPYSTENENADQRECRMETNCDEETGNNAKCISGQGEENKKTVNNVNTETVSSKEDNISFLGSLNSGSGASENNENVPVPDLQTQTLNEGCGQFVNDEMEVTFENQKRANDKISTDISERENEKSISETAESEKEFLKREDNSLSKEEGMKSSSRNANSGKDKTDHTDRRKGLESEMDTRNSENESYQEHTYNKKNMENGNVVVSSEKEVSDINNIDQENKNIDSGKTGEMNNTSKSSQNSVTEEDTQINSKENQGSGERQTKQKERSNLNKTCSTSLTGNNSDSNCYESEKDILDGSRMKAGSKSESNSDTSDKEMSSDLGIKTFKKDGNNGTDLLGSVSDGPLPKPESLIKQSSSNRNKDENESSSSINCYHSDSKPEPVLKSDIKKLDELISDNNTDCVENCLDNIEPSDVADKKIAGNKVMPDVSGHGKTSDSTCSRTDNSTINGLSDKNSCEQHTFIQDIQIKSKELDPIKLVGNNESVTTFCNAEIVKSSLKAEIPVCSDKDNEKNTVSNETLTSRVLNGKGAACEVNIKSVKTEQGESEDMKSKTEMKPLFEKFIFSGALKKQELRKNLQDIKKNIQLLQNSLEANNTQNNIQKNSSLKGKQVQIATKGRTQSGAAPVKIKPDDTDAAAGSFDSSESESDSSDADSSSSSSSSSSESDSDPTLDKANSDKAYQVIDQGDKVKSEIDLIISDAIGDLKDEQNVNNTERDQSISSDSSEKSTDSIIITKTEIETASESSSVKCIDGPASPDPVDDDDSDNDNVSEKSEKSGNKKGDRKQIESHNHQHTNGLAKDKNEMDFHIEINSDYNSDSNGDDSVPSSTENIQKIIKSTQNKVTELPGNRKVKNHSNKRSVSETSVRDPLSEKRRFPSKAKPGVHLSQLPETTRTLAQSTLDKIIKNKFLNPVLNTGQQPKVFYMTPDQIANLANVQNSNFQVLGNHASKKPQLQPKYVFLPGSNKVVPIEQFAKQKPEIDKHRPVLQSLLTRPNIAPKVLHITQPPRMLGPRPTPDYYITKMKLSEIAHKDKIISHHLTEAGKGIIRPIKTRKPRKPKVIEIDSSDSDASDASFEKMLDEAQKSSSEVEEDLNYDYDTLSNRVKKARNQDKKDSRYSQKGMRKDQPITFSSDEVDSDMDEKVPYIVGRNALRLMARKNYGEMDITVTETDSESDVQEIEIPEELSDEPCKVCGKKDNLELLLMCDECDDCYHADCLSPPMMVVPTDDWFCPPCEHEKLLTAMRNKLEDFLKEAKRFQRKVQRKQREQQFRERIALRSAYVAGDDDTEISSKPLPMGTNFGLSLDNILIEGRSRSTRNHRPVKYTTEEFDNKLNEALKTDKNKKEGKQGVRRGRSGRSYKDESESDVSSNTRSVSWSNEDTEDSEAKRGQRKGRRSTRSKKTYAESESDSEGEKRPCRGRRSTRNKQKKYESETDSEGEKTLRRRPRSTRNKQAKSESETESEGEKKLRRRPRSMRNKQTNSENESESEGEKRSRRRPRSSRNKQTNSENESESEGEKRSYRRPRSLRNKHTNSENESESEGEKRSHRRPRSLRNKQAKSESETESEGEKLRRRPRSMRNKQTNSENESESEGEKRSRRRPRSSRNKQTNSENESESEGEKRSHRRPRSLRNKQTNSENESESEGDKRSHRRPRSLRNKQANSENESESEGEKRSHRRPRSLSNKQANSENESKSEGEKRSHRRARSMRNKQTNSENESDSDDDNRLHKKCTSSRNKQTKSKSDCESDDEQWLHKKRSSAKKKLTKSESESETKSERDGQRKRSSRKAKEVKSDSESDDEIERNVMKGQRSRGQQSTKNRSATDSENESKGQKTGQKSSSNSESEKSGFEFISKENIKRTRRSEKRRAVQQEKSSSESDDSGTDIDKINKNQTSVKKSSNVSASKITKSHELGDTDKNSFGETEESDESKVKENNEDVKYDKDVKDEGKRNLSSDRDMKDRNSGSKESAMDQQASHETEEELDYKTRIEKVRKKSERVKAQPDDSESNSAEDVDFKTRTEQLKKKGTISSDMLKKRSDSRANTKQNKTKDRTRDSNSETENSEKETKNQTRKKIKDRVVRNSTVKEPSSASEDEKRERKEKKSRKRQKQHHHSKGIHKHSSKKARLANDDEEEVLETDDSDYNCNESTDSEDKEWDAKYFRRDCPISKKEDQEKDPYVTRSGRSTNSSSRIKKYL